MSDRSITGLLADVGIRHEPSSISGKRDLYGVNGEHIGTFDSQEAVDYLAALQVST